MPKTIAAYQTVVAHAAIDAGADLILGAHPHALQGMEIYKNKLICYCMGNFVAKMQLRAIFDELLHRAPTLELGEPEYLAGNFVHAVKSMPCRIR